MKPFATLNHRQQGYRSPPEPQKRALSPAAPRSSRGLGCAGGTLAALRLIEKCPSEQRLIKFSIDWKCDGPGVLNVEEGNKRVRVCG